MEPYQGNNSLESDLEAPAVQPGATAQFNRAKKGQVNLLRFNRMAFLVTAGAVSVMLLIGGGAYLFSRNTGTKQNPVKTGNFAVGAIPLANLSANQQLMLGQAEKLTINGQLEVNAGLVITPSAAPETGVAGQVYFDQATNQPYFYNGTAFVSLVAPTPVSVSSIGGQTGVVGLGNGIRILNGQLQLTDAIIQGATAVRAAGVTSVQGQSGAVSFTGGTGIAVNGTQVTNTGLLSLGGAAGNLGVGRGLSVQGGALRSTVSLAAGTSNLVVTDDGAGNYTISDVSGSAGNPVDLGPTLAQADNTNNVSLNINKLGTGDFIRLASNGVDAFVVSQAGVITNGTIAYTQVTGAPATTVTSLGGSSGAISLGAGLAMSSGTLANTGVVSVTGTTDQIIALTSNGAATLSLPQNIATTSSPSFTNLSLSGNLGVTGTTTIGSLGTGIVQSNSSGVLSSGAADRNAGSLFSNALSAANGGTGLNGGSATNGQLLIGNGSGYTLANLTQGSGISITNGAGSIAIAVDNTICTTSGNCAGSGAGVTTAGGTTGTIALFTAPKQLVTQS